MSRIENITAFADRKNAEEVERAKVLRLKTEKYIETIRGWKSRIDELIEVGNACREHGIPLTGQAFGCREGYDTHQFVTNGWSHLLGFLREVDPVTRRERPFRRLGIMGGGACHFDLYTDGNIVEVSGTESLYVLERFVNEFDTFEREFYSYVDKVTGAST